MSFTQRIEIRGVAGEAGVGPTIAATNDFTGGATANLSETIPADATTVMSWAMPRAAGIKAIIIHSTVGGLTVTSDGGTPDVVELAANVPYQWCTGTVPACIIDADCTEISVDNTGGAEGTLTIYCVYDPTA